MLLLIDVCVGVSLGCGTVGRLGAPLGRGLGGRCCRGRRGRKAGGMGAPCGMCPGELIEVGKCSWWAGEGAMEMGRGELGRWGIGVVARWGREEVRSMREGWGARDRGGERW